MENILIRIKTERERLGLNQKDMAEKLGITQSGYNLIENGKVELTISKLTKIAEILKVPIQVLMGFANENGQNNIDVLALQKENERITQQISVILDTLKNRQYKLGKLYEHIQVIKLFLENHKEIAESNEAFIVALNQYLQAQGRDVISYQEKYKYAYKLDILDFIQVALNNFDLSDFEQFKKT